jgi:hypothetical protein
MNEKLKQGNNLLWDKFNFLEGGMMEERERRG